MTNNVPRRNLTLAALSTGRARDSNDVGFISPVNGTNFGRTIAFPGAARWRPTWARMEGR